MVRQSVQNSEAGRAAQPESVVERRKGGWTAGGDQRLESAGLPDATWLAEGETGRHAYAFKVG